MLEATHFLTDRPNMDLLSDVLRDLRLASAVLSVAELSAPWGIEKSVIAGAPFYIILEGRCLLEADDHASIELAQGDLVIWPHGHRHALVSSRGAKRTSSQRVLEANGVKKIWRPGLRVAQLQQIRFGGRGALTRIVMGVFSFQDRRRNPLLEGLPSVIHVRGHLGRGPAWLESSLALLIEELTACRPGFQTVAERVTDTILVQAVRHYVANAPTNGSGWLRGLTDPQVAHALSMIHSRPGEAWTVASLATAVALSRTVFANRFRELVGSTVMEYVTARRMHVAAGMLASSSETLAGIANEVGYESEISFSRAFRRWGGIPPAQYRRHMKESASVPEGQSP